MHTSDFKEAVMDYEKAERLAALLDGTCSDEEREKLLAQLAEDDDDLEVFAAAGAALHQHEEEERRLGLEDRDPAVIPRPATRVTASDPAPRRRPPRRWIPFTAAAGLAMAAGVAALIALPRLRGGSGSGAAAVVAQL